MIHHKKDEFARKIDGDIYLGQIKHVTWYPDSRLRKAVELGDGEIELCIYARDGSKLAIHMDQQTLREIHGIAEEFDESLQALDTDDVDDVVDRWVSNSIDLGCSLADIQLEIADRWKRLCRTGW